jgi:hypothetical protein
MIFLLRQVYIVDHLQNSSGKWISLFTTSNGAAQPTPLIFFFHHHLSNTLIKAMWLIRLIKMYAQLNIGRTSPESLSEDQKIYHKILFSLSSNGLSEDACLTFLYETQKLLNPEPESTLRSMWITGRLPESYQGKMDSFFALFAKFLPNILQKGNDLFSNMHYLQLRSKSLTGHSECMVDVISKKRIFPVFSCAHCGHYSVTNSNFCACGGTLIYVIKPT